jgi:hypothetical protein
MVGTCVRGLHHEHEPRHFVAREKVPVGIGNRISPVGVHRIGHAARFSVGLVLVSDGLAGRVNRDR